MPDLGAHAALRAIANYDVAMRHEDCLHEVTDKYETRAEAASRAQRGYRLLGPAFPDQLIKRGRY